jgi:ubiquinone/menaquinone biosynthesis C-methylase UbiE
MTLQTTINSLPRPFNQESFSLTQKGIYDSEDTDVYLNDSKDFAFLFPIPIVDYFAYVPRVKSLGLSTYKRTTAVTLRRFEKIKNYFDNGQKVLEIGSGAGEFLSHVSQLFPDTQIASLEIDQNTKTAREKLPGLHAYASFQEMGASQETFDLICMFHVLEHIIDPKEFLNNCLASLAPMGILIIEVPSLDDPLISLYESQAYRAFYFQRQHPYIYTARSLCRLLAHENISPEHVLPHQRYGLENHLNWLAKEKPGGNEAFRRIFKHLEDEYLGSLEQSELSDSVIIIAQRK